MNIRAILDILEAKLIEQSDILDITICGGAAIHLLGYSNRPTQDIDVICPKLPPTLTPLIQQMAQEYQLAEDWLNNGPEALMMDLEVGWEQRTVILYQGQNLLIRVLSRQDLIFTKLYAMCDRREDIRDLMAMSVSSSELHRAGVHVKSMDGHPEWPDWVDSCIIEILEQERDNG